MEVWEERDYIPIASLSPPEWPVNRTVISGRLKWSAWTVKAVGELNKHIEAGQETRGENWQGSRLKETTQKSCTQSRLFCWWMLSYNAILRSRVDSLRSHVILHEWRAFYRAFLISTKVACLQHWHGWCHMKLLPSRSKFCVHHTTMHHVTSCKATICKVYAYLVVTCHLHFWQNDRDLFTCYCGNTGVERIPK